MKTFRQFSEALDPVTVSAGIGVTGLAAMGAEEWLRRRRIRRSLEQGPATPPAPAPTAFRQTNI